MLGEIFLLLPPLDEIFLSVFENIDDRNSCIFSMHVNREQWNGINFKRLRDMNLLEALNRFKPNINITKKFVFKKVSSLL